MSRMQNSWRVAALAGVASALVACLPKDTRPPPSRVLLTASPAASLATRTAITTTDDGWELSFARVLITLGRASLDGDKCSTYSEARYSRVLSLVGAPAQEKISESFALGHCDFGFGVLNAESDSLLGPTVTSDDVSFLRTLGEDKYAGSSGVSLYVEGRAAKGSDHEKFAWKFRGRVRLEQCAAPVGAELVQGLDLAQDGDVNVDVVVTPELLFADRLKPDAARLRFDPIAAADTQIGNGDGEVTLDELGQAPVADLAQDGAYAPGDTGLTFTTLEDFVYLGVAPTVARYQGDGTCKAQLRPARGGGG